MKKTFSEIKKNKIYKQAQVNDQQTDKEIEKLNDKIRDFIRKILISQIPSEIDVKASNTFFQTKQGRKCMANLIYQEKFKTHKSHQLSEKGFELMTHLISNLLILAEFIDDQLDDVIKVIKACFHYYKINEGKSKECFYIYKQLLKNQIKLWENDRLWVRWYEIEVTNKTDYDMSLISNNPDDYYFSKFFEMFNYMKDLYLDLSFILSCVETIARGYIRNINSVDDLMKVIEKQIKIRPPLSLKLNTLNSNS